MWNINMPRIHPSLAALAICAVVPLTAQDGPIAMLDDITAFDDRSWVLAASRRLQPLASAPAAVEIITAEDFARSPALTIPDYLRYKTGIDVYQDRHNQFDVGLRGFNSLTTPRTLATYDGRSFGFDELGMLLWTGFVHTSDIQRIEVVKGPASVTYGANAFGGVISIQGREVKEKTEVYTLMQGGSDGFLDGDATALAPIKTSLGTVTLKACVGMSRRDDLETVKAPNPSGTDAPNAKHSGDTDLESSHGRVVVGLNMTPKHRIETEWWGYNGQTIDMHEPYTLSTDYARSRQQGLRAKLAIPDLEVSYGHSWATGWWNTTYFGYDNSLNPLTNNAYSYDAAGFRTQHDEARIQYSPTFKGLIIGEHTLGVGAEWNYYSTKSNLWDGTVDPRDAPAWDDKNVRNTAFFLEDQWRPTRPLAFTLGARIDANSEFGTDISPRVGVNYAIDDNQFVRAGFSRGYRLPVPIETFMSQHLFTSDPDLTSEKIESFDMGWQRKFSGGSTLRLGSFVSRATDVIWSVDRPDSDIEAAYDRWIAAGGPLSGRKPGPFFEFTNLDNPLWIGGLEGELRHEWFQDRPYSLATWANGTWQKYRFEHSIRYDMEGFQRITGFDPNTGQPIVSTLFQKHADLGNNVNEPPEWKACAGIDGKWKGWQAATILRYVGDHFAFQQADTNWFLGNEVQTQTVGEYVALDASLGYGTNCAIGYVQLRAVGLNLFDNRHFETYTPSAAGVQRPLSYAYGAEIGRFLGLELAIRFGGG
jgi:outer membrane receptor for ferrienterochelin and colicin